MKLLQRKQIAGYTSTLEMRKNGEIIAIQQTTSSISQETADQRVYKQMRCVCHDLRRVLALKGVRHSSRRLEKVVKELGITADEVNEIDDKLKKLIRPEEVKKPVEVIEL